MTVIEKDVENKEWLGRYKFEEFCRKQSWCVENKFSHKTNSVWDVGFWSATTTESHMTPMIGEIKYRNYNSNDYDSWFLELDKLLALRDIKYLYGIPPDTRLIYINIYNNGAIRLWDITNNEYQPYRRELQKNDTYNDTKEKLVIDLKNEDAIFEIKGMSIHEQAQQRIKEIRQNKSSK